MELVSCQPPDDFLLPGVLRTNFCRGQALFCHDINQDIARVLSFNALMGLSCYIKEVCQRLYDSSFNALMGLSCYINAITESAIFSSFQCPHGLELLPPTRDTEIPGFTFQCPHGLELLRQECPIF